MLTRKFCILFGSNKKGGNYLPIYKEEKLFQMPENWQCVQKLDSFDQFTNLMHLLQTLRSII